MTRLLGLAAASILAVSGSAYAQMAAHDIEGIDHARLRMYLKLAQLSDDQKVQTKAIMGDIHRQIAPLVHQMQGVREQLSDKIVSTGPLQLSDLAPLRQQIRDLQIHINDIALGAVLKVRGMLRPDQLQRIADAHAKVKNLKQQLDDLTGSPEEMEPGAN